MAIVQKPEDNKPIVGIMTGKLEELPPYTDFDKEYWEGKVEEANKIRNLQEGLSKFESIALVLLSDIHREISLVESKLSGK